MSLLKITKLGVALLATIVLPLAVAAQQSQSEQGSAQPATQPAPAQQTPPAEKAAVTPDRNAPQESHIGKYTGHSGPGRQLYFRYCWGCHGFRGDGNGENAPYLNILPRNFVAATFKCRSTPTGTLPLDQDLYNSLERGLNNSNMPSWITLTSQNRADLIAFIKTFSPRWQTEKSGDPINVPAEPTLAIRLRVSIIIIQLRIANVGSAGTLIGSPDFSVCQRCEEVLMKATRSARFSAVRH